MTRLKSSITRRRALAVTAGVPLALRALGAAESKPNIIYMMADDMGYADLSCYGRREYRTPNIDGLAAGGVRFLQAYANSSVCSATRTALITGRYQYRLPVGLEEPIVSAARKPGLPANHPTLPSLLKKAGYGTTLIGKWHLGYLPDYSPLKSGYDHFWGFQGGALDYFSHKASPSADTDDLWDDSAKVHEAGYLTNLLGDRAVKVIGDYAKSKQPFFLSLHFNAPHWPWEGPEDEAESRRVKVVVRFRWRVAEDLWAHGYAIGCASGARAEGVGDQWARERYHRHFHQRQRGRAFFGHLAVHGEEDWICSKEGCASRRWCVGRGISSRAALQIKSRSRWIGCRRCWRRLAARPIPKYPLDGMNLLPALDAECGAGSAQIILALSLQRAAGHARRRHEVAEDQREHFSVQRGGRSAGTRQFEGPATGGVSSPGRRL